MKRRNNFRALVSIFSILLLLVSLCISCEEDTTPKVLRIQKPILTENSFVYDGTAKALNLKSNSYYQVKGEYKATDAGVYFASVSLTDPLTSQWADGSIDDISIVWEITKKQIEKPVLASILKYNGEKQGLIFQSTPFYSITGETEAKSIGSYEVVVSLNDEKNTSWADGTSSSYHHGWEIVVNDLSDLSFRSEFTYDGVIHGVEADLPLGVTISIDSEGLIYSGSKTVTATLTTSDSGYVLPWETKVFELKINRAVKDIHNLEELDDYLRSAINFNRNSASSITYRLVNDIDGNGSLWSPVGSTFVPFMAELDGNGHKISNLVINNSVTEAPTEYSFWQNMAFFGTIADGASIHDLTLENVVVNGYQELYAIDTGDPHYVHNYCFAILYGSVKISDMANNSANYRKDLFYQDVANSKTVIENILIKDCAINITESPSLSGKKAIIGGVSGYDSFGDPEYCIRRNLTVENLSIDVSTNEINVSTNEAIQFWVGPIAGCVNATPLWYDSEYAKYENITISGGSISLKHTSSSEPKFYLGSYFGFVGFKSDSGYPVSIVAVDLTNASSNIALSAKNKNDAFVSVGLSTGGFHFYGKGYTANQVSSTNAQFTGTVNGE